MRPGIRPAIGFLAGTYFHPMHDTGSPEQINHFFYTKCQLVINRKFFPGQALQAVSLPV
jgi:hypothetical protein